VVNQTLQKERYELKYVVSESAAMAMRSLVRTYLPPDEHTKNGEVDGYMVESWYLDSPHLLLYRQTQDGLRNRYKLRVRWYDRAPDAPAFIEIKRRTDDVIQKSRAELTKDEVLRVVNGGQLSKFGLELCRSTDSEVIKDFCNRRDRLSAHGVVLVTYSREAYQSPVGNHVRITFDRNIVGRRCTLWQEVMSPRDVSPSYVSPSDGGPVADGVVVEMKYTREYPEWMRELVQLFELQRVSFPKYNSCVDALGLTSVLKSSGRLSNAPLS